MCERTFKWVRGVGNIEFRISLVGEEIRQITFHTEVRTSCFLVGVVPVLRTKYECPVGEDVWVRFLPVIEEFREFFFGTVGELEHDPPERLAFRRLWSSREIFGHRLHLMKLAHLYGYTLKNLEHSSFSIHNDCLKCPSAFLKYLPAVVVVCHDLFQYISPPDILFQVRCSEYTDTPRSSKEGGVDNKDGWLRCNQFSFYLYLFKLRAHPLDTMLLLLR